MIQYIVDAFTDKIFKGNQAAVCVMDNWPKDELMLNIANENNFSETAFTVKNGNNYELRWFTPIGEIDLCGHATLATSFVLFEFYEKEAQQITFSTKYSGELIVKRKVNFYEMDFPRYQYKQTEVTPLMEKALKAKILEAYLSHDLLLVLENEKAVINLNPDIELLKMLPGSCIAVTAKGSNYDCVSRVFVPNMAIPEDPVTGSSHCLITPYWCEKLGKHELNCFQASNRTGELHTILNGDRIIIQGKATLFSQAKLFIEKNIV